MTDPSKMYEIVPVDPLSKIHSRTNSLEKDIHEIKNALRSTVGISKLQSNADEFIKRMMDMLNSTHQLVQEVADSNQIVAQKIQEAIDRMNEANDTLTRKLTKILEFFEQATEEMGEEGEETSDEVSGAMTTLNKGIAELIRSTQITNKSILDLQKNMGRPSASGRPAMPPPPQMQTQQRQTTRQPVSNQQQGNNQQKPQNQNRGLPPPPFPP
jgi:chromosome segregation ATPase